MLRFLVFAISFAFIATVAKAHEFWIEPENYQIVTGSDLVAELRVGQRFNGGSQSYLRQNFRRFEFSSNGETALLEGRLGDRPAVRLTTSDDGLMVLIHETTDFRLTWDEFEEFETFLVHKDAAWVLEAHDTEGLSRENVTEAYSRYAKSLVAVGSGAGSDFKTGLETEIIALENPYTDEMADGIDVRVLYQGMPRAGEQIEVFEKADGQEVSVFTLQTDDDGMATIPVKPGYEYMVDSVVLRKASAELASSRDVIWESLWANLTFAIPDS